MRVRTEFGGVRRGPLAGVRGIVHEARILTSE